MRLIGLLDLAPPFSLEVVAPEFVQHNDNEAHEAIRSLLEDADWFDGPVRCGLRPVEANLTDSEWRRFAYIQTFAADPVPDGSPLREYREGTFILSLFARCVLDDQDAEQELIRLEAMVRNLILHPDNRALGGFCLSWKTTLRRKAIGYVDSKTARVDLRGTFGYVVSFAGANYSETA